MALQSNTAHSFNCRSQTHVIFITVQSPHHLKITPLNVYSIQAAACTQFATESRMKTTLTLLFLFIVAQKQGLYFMSSVKSVLEVLDNTCVSEIWADCLIHINHIKFQTSSKTVQGKVERKLLMVYYSMIGNFLSQLFGDNFR